MDVQIVFLPVRGLLRIKRFDQAHGDLGGFFHDISELAGDLHLAASFGLHRLNK